MTDQELKQEIIDKHIFHNKFVAIAYKNEITKCMEEWASIISKRTEDNLLEELGFTEDSDKHTGSIDYVFKEEL
jgi:hypothetical protein